MTEISSAERGRLHALVIGIDDYPYVHAHPLRGCRNDAERTAGLLADGFGFRVRRLLDQEATRAGILEAMSELLRRARRDDRVVLHFSGHGSRIQCPDGSSVETLLPHDSGRGRYPNRDVTDQELYGWLLRLSAVTPYIALIFDSCHAGGIVRDSEATARGVDADERPEALADKAAFLNDGPPQRVARDPGPSGWLPLSDRYTLIAACRAGERARELEDPATSRIHGALTCFLAEELTQAAGPLSYRDLFERVSIRIHARYREQNPQLEGAWDREVFGTRQLAPMHFVPVRSRQGPRVELGAGAAHGLVLGSEWQVYQQGIRCPEGAQSLGRLRIDEVRAVRAGAELLDELSPGAVDAGGRAVEVARPPEIRRLAVGLRGAGEMAELAQRIDQSRLLERAADEQPWDLMVHRLAPRDQAAEATPVPQLGPLRVPVWAITDGSGRLVMMPKLVAWPAAVDRVLSNLETWARHRALAQLRHPDPGHPLRDALEIELRRRRPRDHDWGPAERGPDGSLVYEEGDLLGIHLRHHHEAPLHVAVLDLGLTGSVRLLFPVRGASCRLPPWCDLGIAMTEGEEIELYVPEELPYPGETFERAPETLVFLATTEEADLAILAQDGVRRKLCGASGERWPASAPATEIPSPLATLLRLAFDGVPHRDTRKPPATASSELWTVVTRSLWLRRPNLPTRLHSKRPRW